jgi:hypothetical protein
MVKKLAVLAVLTSIMAFGQYKAPAGGSTAPTSPAGADQSNIGTEDKLHVKSIDQVLHDDARLSATLKAMLPADLTPQQACAGFKTLEQCVTAIHLAQNLKLPFADLKAKTTGKGSIGMQKAIEQMAANANAKEELKKAKRQAAEDMKGTNLFGALFFREQLVLRARPIAV